MKTLPKTILTLSCFLILSTNAIAGTILAGDITYRNISNLTYEFTVSLYQLTANLDSSIVVNPGGVNDTLTTSNNINLGTLCGMNVSKSVFVFTHTYAGNGTYVISAFASNRFDSIANIPNSGSSDFALQATLLINPFFGTNNSPTFNYPPIDNANLNTLYLSDQAAIDIDGDSLSYQLVTPSGATGYTLPPASNSFNMDSLTGNIAWDSPMLVGYFSVGILLTEWRNDIMIGNYNRELFIAICQTNGLSEFQNETNNINIFPNPASDNLDIASQSSESKFLIIYNSLGESVLSENFNEQKHSINISTLAKGIYLIKVRPWNGIITKRIVKQ